MEFKDKYWGLWLVVKPTVGIPIFFLAIMFTALAIHWAVLTHTTWFSAYWQGRAKGTAVSEVLPAPVVPGTAALASR